MEALDTDIGIGYSHSTQVQTSDADLIENLLVTGQKATYVTEYYDYIQNYVLKKYVEHLKTGANEIVLYENELNEFKELIKEYRYPNSMYLMGSLYKKNQVLDKDNFLFDINVLGGPSAGSLLGRFITKSPVMTGLTYSMLESEEQENPDAVYAEIVHFPQPRVGNILFRPVLRKYELPYVCQPGVDSANVIKLNDLYVGIENDEVILRSKTLNKRVIPRLSSAHNFTSNSLHVYKFLCDLQTQGAAFANVWDWGVLKNIDHLPRVVYKNLIIKKAQWAIRESEVIGTDTESINPESLKEYFFKNKIPAQVVYVEGDNELALDISIPEQMGLLWSYLRKRKTIEVKEIIFSGSNCVVKDKLGNPFLGELIIPFERTNASRQDFHVPAINFTQEGIFTPGSEWLYYKVYGGTNQLNNFLCTYIHPYTMGSPEETHFEKFFFVRYKDPDEHLRIRFYQPSRQKRILLESELNELFSKALLSKHIYNFNIDTYRREIKRYHKDLINEAESLFFNDSVFAIELLKWLGADCPDVEPYIVAETAKRQIPRF
jgi:hypothetical protein